VRKLLPQRSTESVQRGTEATIDQLIATGAAGTYGIDPIDGDAGFVRVGQTGRQIPIWTREKMRAYSVAAYRLNPMARAVIDTYVAFCVGDSGLTLQCHDPETLAVAKEFWNDPKVKIGVKQEAFFREHLIYGETLLEMLVGPSTGVCRINPIDPTRITDVELIAGNVLWPGRVHISTINGQDEIFTIAQVDDLTGLRDGEVEYWASFNTLVSDQRGDPFLGPILDDLEAYDTVLSNLVDRTALARYMVWDVEVDGDQKMIDKFLADRGGNHVPRSGTIEVHNKAVQWKPQFAQSGIQEDAQLASTVLTNVAGGAGLGKTWLAEPDGANRATSLSMAEPIRRRVGSVQNIWLGHQTELLRYVVDQAVAAGRIAKTVTVPVPGGGSVEIPASQSISVHGPEVAAADSDITAGVLVQLSQSIISMTATGLLSPAAARLATKKAWEQFVGIPYTPDLDKPDGSAVDGLTEIIGDAEKTGALKLALKL
jgi:hypothetical protein